MNPREKVELAGMLEQKGAFQARRAVPIVVRSLKVSRCTVYDYLAEPRAQASMREKSELDLRRYALIKRKE
jgi:predicted transcriptional regulator YheO